MGSGSKIWRGEFSIAFYITHAPFVPYLLCPCHVMYVQHLFVNPPLYNTIINCTVLVVVPINN